MWQSLTLPAYSYIYIYEVWWNMLLHTCIQQSPVGRCAETKPIHQRTLLVILTMESSLLSTEKYIISSIFAQAISYQDAKQLFWFMYRSASLFQLLNIYRWRRCILPKACVKYNEPMICMTSLVSDNHFIVVDQSTMECSIVVMAATNWNEGNSVKEPHLLSIRHWTRKKQDDWGYSFESSMGKQKHFAAAAVRKHE